MGYRRLILIFLLTGAACLSNVPESAPEPVSAIDLTDRFEPEIRGAAVSTAEVEERYFRRLSVHRRGVRSDALVLVAPLTVSADLSGLEGRRWLHCFAAPVYNVGDGMLLEVLFRQDDREELLFERLFDAGRKMSDREWNELVIPLDLKRSESSRLVLRVGGGPAGNLDADWLAVSRPVLKKEPPK